MQVDPWWNQHWVGAQNATSNIVRSAFRHIQQAHPYWNRSNGADHFLVYSYDRGTVPLLSTVAAGRRLWGQDEAASRCTPLPMHPSVL